MFTNIAIGIVGILISIIQIHFTNKGFKETQKKGNKNTNPFSFVSFYFSYGFSAVVLIGSLAYLLDAFL